MHGQRAGCCTVGVPRCRSVLTWNSCIGIELTFIAGTFSLALQAAGQPNGGADGSILVDPNEVLRSENNGLQNIVSLLAPMPAKFGVAPGDILHVRRFLPSRRAVIDLP